MTDSAKFAIFDMNLAEYGDFVKSIIFKENKKFVGRTEELAEIKKISTLGVASILTVYGRRRTGKTELIEQALRRRNLLKFEGLENQSPSEQRANFLQQLAKYTDDKKIAKISCKSWREVFEILSDFTKSGTITLYFEEIQWMACYQEDLISDLKYAWDNYFKKNHKLLLVLCGSAPSFIVNKIIKSKALHNRSLHKIHLQEFTLEETREFLGGKNRGLQELMDIYLTVGGIPEYLQYIRKESSGYLAICKESFLSNGFFVDEYEKIFTSSLAKNEFYQKIIEFLAKKKAATRDEIISHLKLESGGTLSLLLQDLEECGFIEKIIPLGATAKSTVRLYSIKDAYLQFYFKFIQPVKSRILDNHFKKSPTSALVMDTYRKWLGFSFERWCRRHSHIIAEKLGFSAVQFESGAIFNRQSLKQEEGFQIDLLYKRKDRVFTMCEIKYTDAPVGTSVIREMEQKKSLLKMNKNASLSRVLISASGADQSLQRRTYFDRILTLEDLIDGPKASVKS